MNRKKLITIVVPLLVGGAALAFLAMLNGPKRDASTATSAVSVPENAAHEKASLEEQLRTNPGHAPILLRLAELAAKEGNSTSALQYLKQAVEADPKNADARLELGRTLFDTGDVEGATRETERLLKDHPDNVDGLYNMGAIYANQNKSDIAKKYWDRAVQIDVSSDSGQKAKEGLRQLGF